MFPVVSYEGKEHPTLNIQCLYRTILFAGSLHTPQSPLPLPRTRPRITRRADI
jgi:hypothetical protein